MTAAQDLAETSHEVDVAALVALAEAAGRDIMEIYAGDFAVTAKDDRSPLTAADMAAHRRIVAGLAVLDPETPVLSEESAAIDWQQRRAWQRYWLVDPLDGTREFIKRNGEFTVNIALIEAGKPVFGVVHAPALDYLVWARHGDGAWLRGADGNDHRLASHRPPPQPLRAAVSRSHLDARTQSLLDALGEVERVGMGSSLKFCRLAEGRADLYPRFGPTSEWDTAAGQCVLEAAGGAVLDLSGQPLAYNTKDSLLNPDFIALGDVRLPWQSWLNEPA